MNQLGLVAISLVLVVSSYDVITSAAQASDDCKFKIYFYLTELDNFFVLHLPRVASVKAFYEYLLNREYAEPLALDHTMERKGVRSPSMRLRFGRRSDPDVPLRVCNLQ